jgi:glucose/arabinose dehydrogenase
VSARGLLLCLTGCPGGGSGPGTGSSGAAAGVTISGAVGGTRIVAMNDGDQILAQDDTPGRLPSAPGQFPFTLAGLPTSQNLRLFFVSNGTVFPLYLGSTDVFSVNGAGPVNLGFVTMNMGSGRSTPEFSPQNVTLKPENQNIPPGLIPAAVPTVSIASPLGGASVPVGPLTVSFTVQNHTVGTSGQAHLHFYLDNDPVPYMFYNGASINDDNGVLYNNAHTHFVHWKTGTSFNIFGLASVAHQVRVILANADHRELANPEATKTLNLTVSQPPTGDLQLQSVLSGLNFPVGLSLAPDSRVFFNERLTGAVRIINQQRQLVNTPFCQLTVQTSGEQGLLGLALDPNFATNRFVYVYYTAAGPKNRVVRYTESSGSCTNETVILDDIPASSVHNGGILQFGPDGKLYIITGDASNTANSQSLTSLAGKILRLNPDGIVPSDNPFVSNANANAKKVNALGIRNSYGFAFHGHTGHLWLTENGPGDSDEINRVVSGGNYGWPTVRGIAGNQIFLDPILSYTPTIAPTGLIAIPEDSTVYDVYAVAVEGFMNNAG